ncbi:rab-interacting lysosomal protein [Trichechus manatus latirostris]|uniref:Rab-interacting lysosomal protein n=1 Tax=Trichechus manatus latirostris TaxID=127582 RepID=A0A2Y9QTU5_TRIMA|nr:rab-interacting lysosomal protein [Trichechus manatus latirostris]
MEPQKAASGEHTWWPPVASGSAAELVYHLAGALGTELQELARRFGPGAATGLVPLVVRALELLEKAAVGPAPDSVSHCPTSRHPRAGGSLTLKLGLPSCRSRRSRLNWSCGDCERRMSTSTGSCAVGHRVSAGLRQDKGGLGADLGPPSRGPPLRTPPSPEERALLRQLKEVTDRQRDELRAHNRDLLQRSQETEALQEQLHRLLLVNAELRHKLAAVQTQLRVVRDRETELQGEGSPGLAQEQPQDQVQGPGCEQRQAAKRATVGAGAPGTPEDPADALQQPERPLEVGQCGFSREELEQILQERNELKANLFLLKEELAFFQRELLSDHRVPGLLLEAMKVAVRKQRKKIKAKMLGTPEEAESSDDEDGSWLLLPSDKGDQPPPPESRIQTLACGIGVKQRPLELGPAAPLPASNRAKRKPHSNLSWSLWPALQAPAPDRPCSALDEQLCLRGLSCPRGLTLGSRCGWMCDLK